jgi:hypothetical protein
MNGTDRKLCPVVEFVASGGELRFLLLQPFVIFLCSDTAEVV